MKIHVKVIYNEFKKMWDIRHEKTDDLITEENDCDNSFKFFELKDRNDIAYGTVEFKRRPR